MSSNPFKNLPVAKSQTPNPTNPFKTTLNYNPLETSGVQGYQINDAPELYRLLGDNWVKNNEATVGKYNDLLALNQSGWEWTKNSAIDLVAQTASGFLAGANYDVPEVADLLKGTEKEYGNWLTDLSQSARKLSANSPIYDTYDDQNSMSSAAYWGKQVRGMGFTFGLVAEGFMEQAALSAFSASTFGAATGLQAARGVIQANKYRRLGALALHGSIKGIQEGHMNAMETFDNTKAEFIKRGATEEEAVKYASQAASLGFKREVLPLMMLNALQFGLVGGVKPKIGMAGKTAATEMSLNTGFSGAIESVIDPLIKNVNNKFLRGTIKAGGSVASESVEEMIQTGISQYATLKALDRAGRSSLFEKNREFWNQEMIDSAIGGALGGSIFHAVGEASNYLSGKREEKRKGKAYDEFLAQSVIKNNTQVSLLTKANQDGDEKLIKTTKGLVHDDLVLENLRYDTAFDGDKAHAQYIGTLNKVYEAANKGDVETLKTYGISSAEDIAFVKDNYPTMISRADDIQQRYEENKKEFENPEDALELTTLQSRLDYFANRKKEVQLETKEEVEATTAYNNLSPTGKKNFDIALEQATLKAKVKEKVATAKDVERIAQLEEQIITDYTEKEEDEIQHTLLNTTKFLNAKANEVALDKMISDVTKDLKSFGSKNNLSDADVENKILREIKSARTVEEVVQAKQRAEAANVASTKVKATAAAKTANLKAPKNEEVPLENFANEIDPNVDIFDQFGSDIFDDEFSPNTNQAISDSLVVEIKPTQEAQMIEKELEEYAQSEFKDSTYEQELKDKKEAIQNEQRVDVTSAIIEVGKTDEDGFGGSSDTFDWRGIDADIKVKQDFEAHREAFTRAIKSLSEDLGKPATFEDYLKAVKKLKGIDVLTDNFNYFAGAFKMFFGITQVEVDLARRNTLGFTSAIEDILDLRNSYEEPTINAIDEVETPIAPPAVKLPQTLVDDSNVPVVHRGYKTITGTPKAGYSSFETKTTISEDEQRIETTIEDLNSSLVKNDIIDPTIILNPEQMLPGTTLTLAMPSRDQLEWMQVTDYVDSIVLGPDAINGSEKSLVEGTPITFANWCKKYNVLEYLSDGSLNPIWLAKVPIVAKNSDGTGIFFIHDTEWYNTKNISQFTDEAGMPDLQKQREVIAEGRQEVIAVRRAYFEGKTNSIKITSKEGGFFKTFEGNQVSPLSEIFADKLSDVKLDYKKNNQVTLHGVPFEGEIMNQEEFDEYKVGTPYEIRQGIKPNEYFVRKTFSTAVTDEVIEMIVAAFEQVYSAEETSIPALKINAGVNGKMDATSLTNFVQFLQRYLSTSKSVPGTLYVKYEDKYLAIGRVGSKILTLSPTTPAYKIPEIITEIKALLYSGTETSINSEDNSNVKIQSNFSKTAYYRNAPHYKLSEKGEIVKDGTYRDYVASVTTSNTMAFNIGTPEAPIYVSKVQPSVHYELSTKVDIVSVQPLIETINPQINVEASVVQENIIQEQPTIKRSEIITQLMEAGVVRYVKENNLEEDC